MAVEIPVVIDIDKAFEDAAKRVGTAMKPLQDYVDANALNLRFKVDEKSSMSLDKILKNASLSSKQLNNALSDVERQIQKIAMKKNSFDMTNGLTDKESQLIQAYTILQRKITGVGNTSTATQKILSINISKVKKEINDLTIKLKTAGKGTNQFDKLNNQLIIAKQNLRNLNAQLTNLRAQTPLAGLETSLTRTNSRMLTLIKNSARLIALHSATRFIRNVREVTAEFELQRVALAGIIQDSEKANMLFRQIKAAAIESPFEIKDLVSYTKQLSAYRIETDKLFDVTQQLADVSAGLGVDMSRLILAYGQVRAASVLRGQELRQFTEAGVPLVELLADKFSTLNGQMVSTAEVFDMISKRAVPFEMIAEIFDDMTDKGGIFYKMQEKQAETLRGQWNNLKDAVSIMYDEIGNTATVHKAMESMISGARQLMLNWREVATVVKTLVASFALFKVASMFVRKLSVDATLAEKSTLALSKAESLEAAAGKRANIVKKLQIDSLKAYSTWMGKASVAQTAFGRGAKQLVANFLGGGWITAAVTAVSLLVSWLVSARQESQRLNKELQKIGSDGATSINRSISNFQRLANAAVSAADGSNEQNEALKELERTYGDLIPSQDLQLKKLRELQGDYSSLTAAIQEKINMQIKEQKVNAATDYYSNKITKSRKSSKKLLQAYGLDKEQINAVLDEIQEAVNDGMISMNDDMATNKTKFEKIILDMTGILVDFGRGFKDYEGQWHQVTEFMNNQALKSLVRVGEAYDDLNDEITDIETDMSSSIGSMGVYAKAWEELQKQIKAVTVSEEEFGKESTFTYKKEKLRKEVELLAKAIEDAFKDTGIDLSDAFDPKGTINFKTIAEAAKSSNKWGLMGYVQNIQKVYDSLVPSNKMVGVIERKFQEIADGVGLSMDDVQGYLLRGDTAMDQYKKEIDSDLEQIDHMLINFEKQKEDYAKHPAVVAPVDEAQVKRAENLREFLRQLSSYLADYESEKKKAAKADKSALAFLKEDLKNVQEIYKRYQEFIKYMGESAAQNKIKEIYGNVTAIDFLDPQSYKKRLNEILQQIRSLQGKVRMYSKEMSDEMYDDIKETIRKSEGLRLEAYKLPGEKYYTIGYGFYKNLPDGREVTEGMKITMEEAEKYLDQYVKQFSNTASTLLAQYGQGMELTERQFNVLVDLAYQGPNALKKALQKAKGDINALAEALKDAASQLVAPQLRESVKKRDMKRYAAFIAGGEMTDDEAKDIAESIFNVERIVQDVDWDEFKDAITKRLKKLSDEIKRSEEARSFYENILGLTGNDDIAASMTLEVYGQTGDALKKQLQDQLSTAFILDDKKVQEANQDIDQIRDKIRTLISAENTVELRKYLDLVVDGNREAAEDVLSSWEKTSTKQIETWIKELQKAKSFSDKRAEIARKTAEKISEINASGLPEEQKQKLISDYERKEVEDVAKLMYEAFKDSASYMEMFENLDATSTKMLRNLRENISRLKNQWKDLDPTELKELQRRLDDIDAQLAGRNPFKAIVEGLKDYRELSKGGTTRKQDEQAVILADHELQVQRDMLEDAIKIYQQKKLAYDLTLKSTTATQEQRDAALADYMSAKTSLDVQAEMTNQAEQLADSAHEVAKRWTEASKKIRLGAEGLSKMNDYVSETLNNASKIIDAFGSDEMNETFGTLIEGVGQTLSGAASTATGIAKLLVGDMTGIVDVISGLSDLVVGIGGTAKKLSIQSLNRQIKEQQRLIENLEESYDSLSKALDRAFGNERVYNFNKMMEIMAAEMEAYRKQAEAERAKGKKADEDTARGYEQSARELEEKMRDLRLEQDAFFAGADLASTAESFADAWLSAYEEFGDTSQAIEERMTEMVQTLMKKAALSGIAQNILGNWYASLADVKDWNAETIATKWKEAMQLVNPMVEGMQTFANSMQSEGISLRNTVGQFTGISRDIAGASEESINGLAAGINTQNFYMSFMPLIHENVAQILTLISGGNTVTPTTQTGIEGMPSVQKMVYDHLPYIDANINTMLQILKSVVSPKSASTATHYVSIK